MEEVDGLIAAGNATADKAATEVWSLKLTPEMKKDILKGGVALSGAGVAATSLMGQEEGYY